MKEGKGKGKSKNPIAGYGNLVFLVGMLIAIVAALVPITNETVGAVIFGVLVLAGLVIGFLNVTGGEAMGFLVAVVALVLLIGPFLGVLTQVFGLNSAMLPKLFSNIITLMVPAAIVVALKVIVLDAKEG